MLPADCMNALYTRIPLTCALASLGLLPAACTQTDLSTNGRNVLLITLDTTRADRLGCYGYAGDTSPRLDRLARMGTLFSNASAQAAVTPVSHASILTGLNPYSHGLRVMHGLSQNRLADSQTTLAEILRSSGYRTAAFVSAFPVTERFGLHQGFDRFDADFLNDAASGLVSRKGIVNTGASQRHAGETTDRALAWLAGAREPYFLWLHYFDPHDPAVLPPEPFRELQPERSASEDSREGLSALYDLEIRYMDAQIGRILDELERTEGLRQTILAVVGDHGQGLGDHDWWGHGILYQEQIRIPLLIVAPNEPGRRTVSHLVRSIDVAPTILELVGADPARRAPMEGSSLVPLLRSDAPDPEYVAYSDSLNMLTYRLGEGITEKRTDLLASVTRGRWKYIHHLLRDEESELYDLAEDPLERENLIASHPGQGARMRELLASLDFLPDGPLSVEPIGEEDRERLRALGYLP